jgi:hypothetical protein
MDIWGLSELGLKKNHVRKLSWLIANLMGHKKD